MVVVFIVNCSLASFPCQHAGCCVLLVQWVLQPIAIDGVAWYVCVSVCLLVTFMSPAQTAKPIELPFVWLTRMGPRR